MQFLSMRRSGLLFVFLIVNHYSYCQQDLRKFRIVSHYTSFPDTGRMQGRLYDSVMYGTPDHYMDSSVLIFVPQNLKADNAVNLIFWFHGWNNNIDTAILKYGIARQFEESGVNAVLVLAETARNSPDSYGGKLEQPNTFFMLIKDVLHKLSRERVIGRNCKAGNILLAGHSGAYRVMAGILRNGHVPVNEVILFDALYANTRDYINWISADSTHRFINLYTDQGGTLDETKYMIRQLDSLHLQPDLSEESSITVNTLRSHRILFIHSFHQHDFIIQKPDNLKLFLENAGLFIKRELD